MIYKVTKNVRFNTNVYVFIKENQQLTEADDKEIKEKFGAIYHIVTFKKDAGFLDLVPFPLKPYDNVILYDNLIEFSKIYQLTINLFHLKNGKIKVLNYADVM